MPNRTVTVRQFLAAQIEVTKDWTADDPRWEHLNVMLDYSIQFGEFKAVTRVDSDMA